MPTLVVKYKDGTRAHPLREGVPVFIGRAKECDIQLPSPAVSRRHAVIIFKNGICGVKDLGSFNGTLINGKTLAAAQHLTDADIVQISSFIIRLDASDVAADAAADQDAQPGAGDAGGRRSTTVVIPHDSPRGDDDGTAPEFPVPDQGTTRRMRDAATKLLAGGSRTFPNSHILLPRAMEPAGDVEEMLENLPAGSAGAGSGVGRDTRAYAPGADTSAFLRAAGKPAEGGDDGADRPFTPRQHVGGGNPESTAEMSFPTEYARELRKEAQDKVEAIMPGRGATDIVDTASEFDFPAGDSEAAGGADAAAGADDASSRLRESCGWFETDYFRGGADTLPGMGADGGAAPPVDPEEAFSFDEPEDADHEARTVNPEEEGAAAGSEASEAEKLIPMDDPAPAPRLTLDWNDDETNRALEELVADVSPAVSVLRSSRAAALGGASGDDAMAAFAQAVGPDEAAAPAELSVLDEVEAAEPPASADADAGAVADDPDDGEGEGDAGATAFPTGDPEMTPMDPGEKLRASAFDTASLLVPEAIAAPGISAGAFAAGKTAIPGVDAVVITPALMAAIDARLALYPALLDLAAQRQAIRGEGENLSPGVAAELARQDAELDALPAADEADKMLAALAARRGELDAVEARARADGLPLPDAGSETLRRAEEIAEAQWRLVRDSNREALPSVYKEAYKLAADESLAREFAGARINHGRLFGGAMYLLALEGLAESAEAERRGIAEEMRRLAEKGLEKDSAGILGKLGKIGDTVNKVRNRTEIREKSLSLEDRDAALAAAVDRANREFAFVEKVMNREFRMVFMLAAKHFGYRDDIPLSVRAFLRYGVIGFKSWWMRADIRDFIIQDCTNNIIPAVEPGPDRTIVLHADEYLGAVANMECPPLPDDSEAGRDRNSVEWLTDRSFRRIVNANSYNILMDDMLSKLDGKLQEYEDKSSEIELRIAELRDWSASDNQDEMFSLQTEQQVIAIRYENMQRHIKRIEKEVVASILEAVEDSEGRFRRGELRMPDSEALVAKESGSLAVMARRIGGTRQRFAPLAVREQRTPAGLNDRKTVAARLATVEKFDPGVFVSAIIPAKKKENRVELRLSPVVIIFPCSGARGVFSAPRDGMEGGHLVVPSCFTKREMAETAFASLLADFRWDTSRLQGGTDIENSDTLAGAFIRFRREFAGEPKARREKGYIFTELTDRRNWRRVYAAFLSDAQNSTRRLPARNPGLYENVIAPYLG